jgi:hypothetical protein
MTGGRIVVAVVFAAAVLGKGRHFKQFVEYLRPVFLYRSKLIAVSTLALEACLALTIPFTPTARVAGLVGIAFLVAATGLIAGRLTVDSQTACACWGAAKAPLHEDLGYADILRPAWYGLRNGAICVAMWLVTRTNGNVAVGLAFACGCLGIMLIGLFASISREREKLSRPEHPKRNEFAPSLAPLIALSWYSGLRL